MRGVAVAAVVVVAVTATGCRQLFGIDDTAVAADAASNPSDAPKTADARPGTPDAPFGSPDATPDAAPVAVTCPTGYEAVFGAPSKYRFNGANRPWGTAVTECAADDPGGHTHLVVIEDAGEKAGLEARYSNDYWIGYTDATTEGTWITVLGTTATFLPWAVGEPNGGTVENCLKIVAGTQWKDADCPNANNYLCECE